LHSTCIVVIEVLYKDVRLGSGGLRLQYGISDILLILI